MRIRNRVAAEVVVLAAPYFWRRYRKRVYVGVALVAAPFVARKAVDWMRNGRHDVDTVRDRMVEPLRDRERSGPAPTPAAFVESARRDERI
jgi:hypothetical protein